jgi:spore maturation protein A
MLNYIWISMIVLAVVIGGITGRIQDVTKAAIDSAGNAVTLALGLIGVMTLWLGIMKIAEDSGLMSLVSKILTPILKKLFPGVPAGHPALTSITMNIAGNMLGLNNAATPMGLKAMEDLEKLNPHPGIATDAMCTFLTINTAGLQLIPATMIGIMSAAGSKDPTIIIGTTVTAGLTSLVVGITVVKVLEKLPFFSVERASREEPNV